jgi:tRNA (adenine37-N6)-methyltransferase
VNRPTVELVPIGVVLGGRTDPVDDDWGAVPAVIELDAEVVGKEATRGLEDFSHLEVAFHFHRVAADRVTTGARRPRSNPAWPEVGILAQRGKARPNRLGISRCELRAVDGLRLEVVGLDAIDGTPVLDVKPWMEAFAPRTPVREPAWVAELMADYWDVGSATRTGGGHP